MVGASNPPLIRGLGIPGKVTPTGSLPLTFNIPSTEQHVTVLGCSRVGALASGSIDSAEAALHVGQGIAFEKLLVDQEQSGAVVACQA